MATVLVTGAAGFIGSNSVRYWRGEHPGDRVVAPDALTCAGVRSNVGELAGVEFVHGSIGNVELVEHLLRSRSADVVVNFAAESHNSLAILRPGEFFATDVMGTPGLCEAARRVGVSRWHHISTCEVHGDLPLNLDEAFGDESPYRPRTPYNAVADTVLGALGLGPEYRTIVPDRPSHDRRYLLDSSKLRGELGWAPRVGRSPVVEGADNSWGRS